MVDQKHKCLPRLSLLFPRCTALQHKLGQRHNPTICQRSFAFGFTFFHCGDPHQPVHMCTQPHHILRYTQARTHAPGGFSDLPETWSWLLSTISLRGERSCRPPQQTPQGHLIWCTSIQSQIHSWNTVVYWADKLADISRRYIPTKPWSHTHICIQLEYLNVCSKFQTKLILCVLSVEIVVQTCETLTS